MPPTWLVPLHGQRRFRPFDRHVTQTGSTSHATPTGLPPGGVRDRSKSSFTFRPEPPANPGSPVTPRGKQVGLSSLTRLERPVRKPDLHEKPDRRGNQELPSGIPVDICTKSGRSCRVRRRAAVTAPYLRRSTDRRGERAANEQHETGGREVRAVTQTVWAIPSHRTDPGVSVASPGSVMKPIPLSPNRMGRASRQHPSRRCRRQVGELGSED